MRRHDLTNKRTKKKTWTKTNTNTFKGLFSLDRPDSFSWFRSFWKLHIIHVLVSNVLWNQTRIEPVSLGGQPTTEVSGAPPCHRGIQLSGRVADQTRVFVLSCSGSSKYLNQKWWLKTPRWTPFWISSSSSSLGQSRPSKTIWQIMQV